MDHKHVYQFPYTRWSRFLSQLSMCELAEVNRIAQMQLMVEPGLFRTENHFTMLYTIPKQFCIYTTRKDAAGVSLKKFGKQEDTCNHVTLRFPSIPGSCVVFFWLISASQQTLSAPFCHLISHHSLSAVMGDCSQCTINSNSHFQAVNKEWQNTVHVKHICQSPRSNQAAIGYPETFQCVLSSSFLRGRTAKSPILSLLISMSPQSQTFSFLYSFLKYIVKRRAQICVYSRN